MSERLTGDLDVRSAEAADAGALFQVFSRARQASMDYLPRIHTDEETAAWLRDVVLVEEEVHVATVRGEVAGFIALGDATVEHLYVAPDSWDLGIGSALLKLAKERRPNGFALWVFQRNQRAIRFYEKRGLDQALLTDGDANEEHEPDARYSWPGTT